MPRTKKQLLAEGYSDTHPADIDTRHRRQHELTLSLAIGDLEMGVSFDVETDPVIVSLRGFKIGRKR